MQRLAEIIYKKIEELGELELFAGVCKRALDQATRSVETIDLQCRIAEVLNEKSQYESEDHLNAAKQYALKVAEFSEGQRKKGSPYLYSLCAVRLWALTEALVDELVVHSLLTPSKCSDQTLLAKLKGPLIEFRAASPDEQAEFLSETLKQLVDAPLKQGAGKFEALLAPVGLSGEINDEIRRTLYELSQVRNIIVHKSGRADRRVVDACPWLDLKRGDSLHVTFKMFNCYRLSVYWYLVAIRKRVNARYDTRGEINLDEILREIEEELKVASADPSQREN